MIIDLHLNGKIVLILGAGNEALKRIKLLQNEDCQIIVIGQKPHSTIERLAKQKKVTLKKIKLTSTNFIKDYKPFLIIASTSDSLLNQKVVQTARKMKILAYASDSPELSDISYLSQIDIKGTIKVGISTSGASPIMAKKLNQKQKNFLEKWFQKMIFN